MSTTRFEGIDLEFKDLMKSVSYCPTVVTFCSEVSSDVRSCDPLVATITKAGGVVASAIVLVKAGAEVGNDRNAHTHSVSGIDVPKALREFCPTIFKDGRGEGLANMHKGLEKCERALTEYLDMKKNVFPRCGETLQSSQDRSTFRAFNPCCHVLWGELLRSS